MKRSNNELKEDILFFLNKNKSKMGTETVTFEFKTIFGDQTDYECIRRYLMDSNNTVIELQDGTRFGISYFDLQHELSFFKQ